MKRPILVFCLILSLLLTGNIFSQKLRSSKPRQPRQILFSDIYEAPRDNSSDLYYLFKIPYNVLVFEKNKDKYEASFRFTIEVADSNKNFSSRQIREKNIVVNDFTETDSRLKYSVGVMKLNLTGSKYYLVPILTDKNSDNEIRFPEIYVNLNDSEDKKFMEPVISFSGNINCNNAKKISIPNFEGAVPFDNNSYNLLIPSADQSLSSVFVTIINNSDTILSQKISGSFLSESGFEECGDKIVLGGGDAHLKYFVVPDFNKTLAQGSLSIIVSDDEGSKTISKYTKAVEWFNIPLSLLDPEFAIKSLKYMEDEKQIDILLDKDENDYMKALFAYWKKYDPTPETTFNELMNEYYLRIDYAAENFSSISGLAGFNSDRGEIFIKFGKPNSVVRNSTNLGRVVETWIYNDPQKKFIFVDERGTGEYKLKNG